MVGSLPAAQLSVRLSACTFLWRSYGMYKEPRADMERPAPRPFAADLGCSAQAQDPLTFTWGMSRNMAATAGSAATTKKSTTPRSCVAKAKTMLQPFSAVSFRQPTTGRWPAGCASCSTLQVSLHPWTQAAWSRGTAVSGKNEGPTVVLCCPPAACWAARLCGCSRESAWGP